MHVCLESVFLLHVGPNLEGVRLSACLLCARCWLWMGHWHSPELYGTWLLLVCTCRKWV